MRTLLFCLLAAAAAAQCTVQGPDGPVAHPDALGALLRATRRCPEDVFQLRALFATRGVRTDTALVGNRGFHNPDLGSFSLFECAKGTVRGIGRVLGPGDLFWGHFTARAADGRLVPDQVPRNGALMIEVVSWDPEAEVYRFYELIGDGRRGRWFYRGDSLDILADTARVHLPRPGGEPIYGARLRCSGCHLLGGPIMKELEAPHEAWWRTRRPLPFGEAGGPGPRLAEMLEGLVDAGELSGNVKIGMRRLLRGKAYRRWRRTTSLRQVLRPLFAPMELELASSPRPLDEVRPSIQVPPGLLRDPRLASPDLQVPRDAYLAALSETGSRFPEIDRADADHPWLGPVKSWSDREWVAVLVEEGIVDEAFVRDVLRVDMEEPAFSAPRAALLATLPDEPVSPGWMARWRERHGDRLVPAEPPHPDDVTALLRRQQARRRAIRDSEISRNPRGQILEPGFRVIFPEPGGAR